jgi:hypothetical protein
MLAGKLLFVLLLFTLTLLIACNRSEGGGVETPTQVPGEETVPVTQPPTAPTAPSPQAAQYADLPVGFPVDPQLRPMQVVLTAAGKSIAPAAANGPTVLEAARDLQRRAENDELANKYGWNCRVHNRHEGAPAIDWYLPEGTPVVATMRGQAELYMITTSNAFEYYGVQHSLTLGLPDPNAPLYPLPGPGGGMGIFVSIVNGDLRAEYGHLAPSSLSIVKPGSFIAPYSPTFNYAGRFGAMRSHEDITLVASWPVEEGDIVGHVGNTGYSDVAHVHYQVLTKDRKTKFCPTFEPFPYNGWLFEPPNPLPR